jgi:hypothetical protein
MTRVRRDRVKCARTDSVFSPARRWRWSGSPLHRSLVREDLETARRTHSAPRLLEEISRCVGRPDAPLKGPVVAARFPSHGRSSTSICWSRMRGTHAARLPRASGRAAIQLSTRATSTTSLLCTHLTIRSRVEVHSRLSGVLANLPFPRRAASRRLVAWRGRTPSKAQGEAELGLLRELAMRARCSNRGERSSCRCSSGHGTVWFLS